VVQKGDFVMARASGEACVEEKLDKKETRLTPCSIRTRAFHTRLRRITKDQQQRNCAHNLGELKSSHSSSYGGISNYNSAHRHRLSIGTHEVICFFFRLLNREMSRQLTPGFSSIFRFH